jgi:hypothetical protein
VSEGMFQSPSLLGDQIDWIAWAPPFEHLQKVYAYRRDVDRAFEWLSAATKPSYGQGVREPSSPPWMMKFSPFIAPLRADPRWDRWFASTQPTG